MSLAKKRRDTVLAQRGAVLSQQSTDADRPLQDRMLILLDTHEQRLRQIMSTANKIKFKVSALPDYDTYVDGVLSAGGSGQDIVLVTIMIWHIDCGHIRRGLDLAEFALSCGMAAPERYKRPLPCIVAEEVAEQALAGKWCDADAGDAVALLMRCHELVDGEDLFDQALAKLKKAIGYALRADGQADEALVWLEAALDIDPSCGVKKDIERLKAQIKRAALTSADPQPGGASSAANPDAAADETTPPTNKP